MKVFSIIPAAFTLLFGLLLTNTVNADCLNTKVIFMAGGNLEDPYSVRVKKGADEAALTLGCKIQYVWSDWSPEKMLQQLPGVIDQAPDILLIYPVPGEAMLPHVQRAVEQGTTVTTTNTVPKIMNQFRQQGFGNVDRNLYEVGVQMAQWGIEHTKLANGDTVFIWGDFQEPTRAQTPQGMIEALSQYKKTNLPNLNIQFLQISDAVNKDTSLGFTDLEKALVDFPSTRLLLVNHASITARMDDFLKRLHIKPDLLYVVGSALSEGVVAGIQSGHVDVVYDYQPFLQGYMTMIQGWLSHQYGFPGMDVKIGPGFVDKNNLAPLLPLIKKSLR